jgi:hypothetical protein
VSLSGLLLADSKRIIAIARKVALFFLKDMPLSSKYRILFALENSGRILSETEYHCQAESRNGGSARPVAIHLYKHTRSRLLIPVWSQVVLSIQSGQISLTCGFEPLERKKGTGHLLKANALICLVRDPKSWRPVRQVGRRRSATPD